MTVKYLTKHFFALQLQYVGTNDERKQMFFHEQAQQAIEQIQEQFSRYEQLQLSREEEKFFHSLKSSWANYLRAHQSMVEQNGRISLQDLQREADTMFQVMEGYLTTLVRLSEEGATTATAQAASVHESGRMETMISMGVALLISLLLSILLTRHIRNPLLQVVQAVKLVTGGQIGVGQLPIKNRDEIGELAKHVDEMRNKLREFTAQVNETAHHVTRSTAELSGHAQETLTASNEIATSLQEISAGTDAMVASAEESAKAMEEMAIGIQRVAESTATLAEASIVAERSMPPSKLLALGNRAEASPS